MLVLFHYLGLWLCRILRKRKRLKPEKDSPKFRVQDELEYQLENQIKFDPPVFKQRYAKIYETLLDEKWRNNVKKLVDFGCAEYGLFIFVKNLNIEEIYFVDIDELVLLEKIGKIEPLLVDRLRRRSCPLDISVFRGSVADPDYRLQKTDVVTAVELIEHLYPDTLEALPYNIFSFIKPKLVIITTPNADFNVVFNRIDGFRHPDHKFEWTREQFQDWANNLIKRFPDYTVEFCGIGEGPDNTKNIGCCSQGAVFTRKDTIYEKYISSAFCRSCQCDINSPCKGHTAECKMLCHCICPFCSPDFSVGICKYFSCNVEESEAYRPMKGEAKGWFSDSELNDRRISIKVTEINPSYNIYFKLLQKIDYPYEVDSRSERERLMEAFGYRIRLFSTVNSRFFMDDRDRCEIPVKDLLYGGMEVSAEETRHILSEAGYQIQKCIIPETNESEYCVVSVPHEMEDITSSSEATDGYSSKSSECNESAKFETNIESLSDWDEVAAPKEIKSVPEEDPNFSAATSSTESQKLNNSDPLFDSGFSLQSPSPQDANPQLLPQLSPPQESQLPLQENVESQETDHFEDLDTTPNLHSNDNKLHLKKTVNKEKFVGMLMPTSENHKAKPDPNRVNELDRFHNMSTVKTFMSTTLRPQNEFKRNPHNHKDLMVAGTSSGWRKSRKFREKEKQSPEKKEPAEPTALDDARSLTNCIIQNSLNRVEVDEEIAGQYSQIIRDLAPLSSPREAVAAIIAEVQNELPNIEDIDENFEDVEVEQPREVENGDLANNNRDYEGKTFIEASGKSPDN